MNIMTFFIAIAALFILIVLAYTAHKKVPRKLKVDTFVQDWKELQGLCKDKNSWSQAIASADKLFDKALRRRRFKGKSMGERMVSAQRSITNNDQMWFAHNMAKKIIADPGIKLKEADVKQALIGFRQALKDIGALQQTDSLKTAEEPSSDQKDRKK